MEPDSASYFRCGIYLWRNVIRRALEEAEGEKSVELTWVEKRRPAEERQRCRVRYREEAKDWLTVDSMDLRIVFHFAQLPGEYSEFLSIMRSRLGYVVN